MKNGFDIKSSWVGRLLKYMGKKCENCRGLTLTQPLCGFCAAKVMRAKKVLNHIYKIEKEMESLAQEETHFNWVSARSLTTGAGTLKVRYIKTNKEKPNGKSL